MKSELSEQHVRSIAVDAAALANVPNAPDGTHPVSHLTSILGAVQLDTISTLARSHELVFYARLGAINKIADIESNLWTSPPTTFEYWSHAACILPLDLHPWFAFRRREFVKRGYRSEDLPLKKTLNVIRKKLAEGPATATELGGARKSGYWWDRSDIKNGLEWLLDIGEVMCTSRRNWRREYQLTENVLSQATQVKQQDKNWVTQDGVYGPSNHDCLRYLILKSMTNLGVGTELDLIDVHRLMSIGFSRKFISTMIEELVAEGSIGRISVQGWDDPAYIDINLRDKQGKIRPAQPTAVMLSPFDQLIWYRERLQRIFGMNYKIEAYTPAAARKFGYFNMPVLYKDSLIARVDPDKVRTKSSTTFIARIVTFESQPTAENINAVAQAIKNAASWINAESIEVGKVTPNSVRSELIRAIK